MEEILPELLEQQVTVFILADKCKSPQTESLKVCQASAEPISKERRSHLNMASAAVYIYTSGTTGEPLSLVNSLTYLECSPLPTPPSVPRSPQGGRGQSRQSVGDVIADEHHRREVDGRALHQSAPLPQRRLPLLHLHHREGYAQEKKKKRKILFWHCLSVTVWVPSDFLSLHPHSMHTCEVIFGTRI